MLRTAKNSINSGVNIEITNKCKIKCLCCPRQTNKKILRGTGTIPLEQIKIIIDTFPQLSFCGQMSDPIYHPDFLEIIKYIDKTTDIDIHTNGHGYDEEWWWNVFVASKGKKIRWIFGLDGLPKDSHKYRVLQDGEQVWEMMKFGAALGCNIEWQYIVFKYNENDIEEARQMAKDNNIRFVEMHSNRFEKHPELIPSEGKYVSKN